MADRLSGRRRAYWFYLQEGDNAIRLETSLGGYTQVIAKADETARALGTLYREIVLITGQNPDANRDYMLAQEIPDLPAQLETLNAALHEVESLLLAIDSRSLSDDAATVRTLYVQIQGFLKDTETIPLRMSSFQTNISSFSDFAAGLKKQPLELDCFAVASPDAAAALVRPGWTARVSYGVRAFLGSFTGDYASIGSVEAGGASVELWVNSISGAVGRDQAQILKQVLDSQFTPKNGRDGESQAGAAGAGPRHILRARSRRGRVYSHRRFGQSGGPGRAAGSQRDGGLCGVYKSVQSGRLSAAYL